MAIDHWADDCAAGSRGGTAERVNDTRRHATCYDPASARWVHVHAIGADVEYGYGVV